MRSVFVALLALAVSGAVMASALETAVRARSTVSLPMQCEALEQVHGNNTVNNWLLMSLPLMPQNATPASLCDEALVCKRLLRPLMTRAGEYKKDCPNECSGNGICDAGVCACSAGYKGLDCSVERCPGKCSGHGDCKLGRCFCEPGYAGDSCENEIDCPAFGGRTCAGHGSCHRGKCFCDPGFTGEVCSQVSRCENECNNKGFCLHGHCFCPQGWGGSDCSIELAGNKCLNDCSGKGECVKGKCQCVPGHYGVDCGKTVDCPKGPNALVCSGSGSCHNGKCECFEGYKGYSCSLKEECPGKGTCSGRGLCLRGTCYCYPGFEGAACDKETPCANGCSDNGVCVEGKCKCLAGYYGRDCSEGQSLSRLMKGEKCQAPAAPAAGLNGTNSTNSTVPVEQGPIVLDEAAIKLLVGGGKKCPNGCSGTGVCLNGTCACLAGHSGGDCSEVIQPLECPNKCNYRGVCVFGRCSCMPPYAGADCSESDDPATKPNECPKQCSGRGTCQRGRCVCDPGYAGHDCTLEVPCKDNCNGRGLCDRGKCFCFPGFEGASCSEVARCPSGCSAHGQCFYGRCFCDPYYHGEDCSESPACTAGCSEHGICRGQDNCVCEAGWTGVACDVKLQCPNDCSGPTKGTCSSTERGVRCICKPGFMGEDCSQSTDKCPNDCSGHGLCLNGACVCNSGYTSADCSQAVGGNTIFEVISKNSQTQAPAGQNATGQAARFRSIPDLSTSAAQKIMREVGVDSIGNHAQGTSPNEKFEPRFRADLSASMRARAACPGPDGKPCNNQGICSEGVCFCNPGFEGAACDGVIACPNDCSKNGVCQWGRCYCDPEHEGTDCSLARAPKRKFPQAWVTAILCALAFFGGLIVGRKTLVYSLKQVMGQDAAVHA